jgi:hypothetical protein
MSDAKVETPSEQSGRWLVFRYHPVALFSLKTSRATSTAGKTLLTPTPYAVKMALVDVALRHRFTADPDALIRALSRASVRIGVSQHACVTGTIQSVRQETREVDRKRHPDLPFYRSTIAMREFVHCRGPLRLAFDVETCTADLATLLGALAPAINYLGRRGSFVQYAGHSHQPELDATFTQPLPENSEEDATAWGQRATLDDFGSQANFEALNSFSAAPIQRGVHRAFVKTIVPLQVHNAGPGFVHYCAPGANLE